MRAQSAISHSIDSLTDAIDSVSFDSLSDLDTPDLSAMSEALSDASTVVADTALVLGRTGSRLATSTGKAAWKHRGTVATVAVVAIVVVAIASIIKRMTSSDDDES